MNEYKLHEKLAYTIPEVARLTGLSVSYLYRLSAEGKLPVCKIGTRCLVLESEFKHWLLEHSREKFHD